ncbi:hypothetical protein K466DRAFT_494187 [Polyporus arcularius HHB13444]|uniref:Uncharacterized protein n=1 Tax=Polyporus arcularius HHB13444 TaxID=1314778 RepID=A0A5C3PAR5_9APHY|nr:hypothetical protein K466DRAFT_494187 [Polyporus arcularius HHB13444]
MSSYLHQQQSLSLLRSRPFAPYRSKSFTPTARDYSDYVQRVLEIVRRPQAAAGLRMGGIIWRILLEVVQDDTDLRDRLEQQASSGPSGEVSIYQEVLQLSPSFAFVDDGLSEEELDIISGVYRVYTDQLNQTADVSWWPKHKHWIKYAGQNVGIWTQWNEKWFCDHLQSIHEGTARPKTSHDWKKALKGHREAKTMGNMVESASKDFIQKYLL